MIQPTFESIRISKTAVISLNGHIDTVFPLFGAFEEKKWAEGWNPVLIYPTIETMEEGTTFKTEGKGDEPFFLWIVSKYQPENHLVQYLVSTPNRYWTITVQCEPIADKTKATITYTYTGLNDEGNITNRGSLEKMYVSDLKDWEEEINNYLDQ